MTYYADIDDKIWKAVSDSKRRKILDTLTAGPMTTGELVELFPNIGRTGVLKHIDVLADVHLITVKREGRTRWNSINTKPLEHVCGPWIIKHVQGITASFAQFKSLVEQDNNQAEQNNDLPKGEGNG